MKSNIDESYLLAERHRIGSRLKELRKSKNLSMKKVSADLGITETTVSKIEAGKWNFGIDTLNVFAVYYQVILNF